MRRERWPVTEDAVRPPRPDGTCFCCSVPVGGEHAPGCVIRERTVVVRFSFDLVVGVPEHWEPGTIEGSYNDSAWCFDNALKLLGNRAGSAGGGGCLCDLGYAEYVREATEDDEKSQHYPPA